MSAQSSKYIMPAEWIPHDSVWLAWPSDASLWEDMLEPAQKEFIGLCEGIADRDPATHQFRGEKLNILVHPDFPEQILLAQEKLSHLPVTFHRIGFGDIWLRDTAPLFLQNGNGDIQTQSMSFNGWGNKYNLPYDKAVSLAIAAASGYKGKSMPWIAEGGALEFDGDGTCLTSKQCLLCENRNPELSQSDIERIICEHFGVEKVLWVTDGLINDHTDGHIDTIARFVAPGKVLLMKPTGEDDPNTAILNKLIDELTDVTDAQGRKIELGLIPSPGKVVDEDGEVMAASYLNFYIGNSAVVVPTYGQPQDDKAVKAIAKYFPNHNVIGTSAKAILTGGGTFHCITQQQPKEGYTHDNN